MKKLLTKTQYIALSIIFFLNGCASHPEPIVDMKGVNEKQFQIDKTECQKYSENIDPIKGIAKGAATGGIIGGATGTVIKNKRNHGSATEKAGVGAIYGATRSGINAEREKQKVFKTCLRGRGYKVLN